MKNIIILVVSILYTTIVYTQNEELDKRNGFKTIKIGMHYDGFANLEVIENEDSKKEITAFYEPLDKDLKYLFGNKIDSLVLIFDKKTKKLVIINLYMFNKTQDDDFKLYNDINDKFEAVLGSYDRSVSSYQSKNWNGNHVSLISSISYDKRYEGSSVTTKLISFSSLDYFINNIKSGF